MRTVFFLVAVLSIVLNLAIDYRLIADESILPHFDKYESLYRYLTILDFVAVFALAALFVWQWLVGRRIQSELQSSLLHLREMNLRLNKNQKRQLNKLKMTVHDIKNPLGTIRGYAELIEEESHGTKEILVLSKTVQKISNETLALVQALLTEQTDEEQNIVELDVENELSIIFSNLKTQAERKQQVLVLNSHLANCLVKMNRAHFKSMVENLVSNAIKFSPFDSEIVLNATVADSKCTITIEDSGPGFTDEDIARAFQPNTKLSAKPTGDELSSGIGLYSVKQLVDKYGGAVNLSNGLRGARVELILPTTSRGHWQSANDKPQDLI